MIRFLRLMCAAIFLLAALPSSTHAQTFPKLTGRVVDDANLIDPAAEASLTAKLDALEKQSGRQLVVATIPDLQGYDISDYAYRLGRAWAIGQKETNNGTVLLIAPNERKVWIATGYGVEGVITDAVASQIVRNDITPRFKAGDYAGGITAGVDQLSRLLTLPPEEARKFAQQAEQNARKQDDGGQAIMVIFWIVVLLFFIVPMAMGRRRGRRYRGGSGPVIIWGPSVGGSGWGDSGGSSWGSGGGWGGGDGGGFSGGGGSFGGGGAGGSW